MNRKEFIKKAGGLAAMTTLGAFNNFTKGLPKNERKMPVLFVGHGSPMNGIENNEFSQYWAKLTREIPRPKAILCISAHWLTRGTRITAMPQPKTIHDFGGFPDELFQVQYPAPGNPDLALETVRMVSQTQVGLDHDWGLDHGCWTIARHMYPEADVPILQLSIDYHKPAAYHYQLAKQLSDLRKKGVLIMGSGNMVHNLRMIAWQKFDTPNYGYDWALEINSIFKKHIIKKEHQPLINYQKLGQAAEMAIPTPDHYYPLMYTLALQENTDELEFFNDRYVGGSLSMTSVKIFES